MIRSLIAITLLFSFLTSFAAEAMDSCVPNSSQQQEIQNADDCCADSGLTVRFVNDSSDNGPSEHEPTGDCCGSLCHCACANLLTFTKNKGFAFRFSAMENSAWNYYKHFYKSPYLDPALKPPLFS